jgi:hypothetical protein
MRTIEAHQAGRSQLMFKVAVVLSIVMLNGPALADETYTVDSWPGGIEQVLVPLGHATQMAVGT